MIFTIMAGDFSGSDTESLPDLDEFLVSSFNPDVSDKGEIGEQENAVSVGLDLRALSLPAIFVGYLRRGFVVRDNHNQTVAIAAATEGTLTPQHPRLQNVG